MTLTPDTLTFLTSAAGTALLDQLREADLSDGQTLPLLTRLRREYPPEQAGAALELARLRHKAVEKFGDAAAGLYFTREALEQASDPRIRAYRAGQITPGSRLLDAGCGTGADALAFAAAGLPVLGVDLDPLRVELARLNAAALNLAAAARFALHDLRDGLPAGTFDAIFFDPARRTADGRRLFDVEAYHPPLSIIRGWHAPQIMVKLSPGVDLAQLTGYGGQVEFIAVDGDLKEAVLHLQAAHPAPLPPRATLLDGTDILHWQRDEPPDERPLSPPRAWLVEPDPALIRAGLVQDAAAVFDGTQLDPTIAYFTTDTLPVSPWVRAWRVRDWLPFNLKRLRAHLRGADVGRVTVKKRGSPLTPEQLIAQLKLKGGAPSRTLVLTRYQGDPIVIICDEHPVYD